VTSDRGGIVLGWLTQLIVGLSTVGLIGFDLVSLGASQLQAEDHAQTAARAAVDAYTGPKDLQAAYDAALAEVLPAGDTIDAQTFAFTTDGTVTLTLHSTAPTLLVHKVSALRSYTEVQRTVTRKRST
jgi:hypothetical protein